MNPIQFQINLRSTFRIFQVAGIILFLCTCSRAQDPGRINLDKLDEYINKAMEEWHIPGLAVAIVTDGSMVFSKGYGVRESGKREKVDEHTVFSIASITKGFTSSALAILEDKDKIDWDDPVQKYLPDFILYDPWVSAEIRIRDLLSHRSGFGTFSGDLIWFETDYSREEVLQRVQYLQPAHGFRYQYGYSNLMYLAAGEIIPAVTDMNWDAFVFEKLLLPLGMDRTCLGIEDLRDDPNAAMPHYVDLLSEETHVLPYMKWDNIAPAGCMNSSVTDLCRWIRFHLEMGNWNGEQIISPENIWETRQIHTIQPLDMASRDFWPSRHFLGYGLGWELYDYHGCKIIGHEGGTDGMLARMVIVPEEDFGFVVLTNSINALTAALEYYILDHYFEGHSRDWSALFLKSYLTYLESKQAEWEEYLASADRNVKPSKDLPEYTGIYGCDIYGNVKVSLENKRLVLDFLPSNALIGDLQHLSKDTFLIDLRKMPAMPQGTVKFFINESGMVSRLGIDIPSPDFDFSELELKRINK